MLSNATVIRVVNLDLSQEETILRIADALDHVSQVTDCLFAQMEAKIEENGCLLNGINERVKVVSKKVDILKESRKATCVYSSSKYPAAEYEPYETALKLDPSLSSAKVSTPRKSKEATRAFAARDMEEKLHFYHVKPKRKIANRMGTEFREFESSTANVRTVPSLLKSASAFLIPDTDINPYMRNRERFQTMTFAPATDQRKTNKLIASIKEDIGEAPVSLATGGDGTEEVANYFYNPELGDLPEFDLLPDALDLPNIAQDLRYDSDSGPGIVPSVSVNQHDSPPLPTVKTGESKEGHLSAGKPGPPPPPLPPPPPPVEPVQTDVPNPSPLPADDRGRGSLMAAIRSAGGTKSLKSSKAITESDDPRLKVKQLLPSGGGGVDLISDLANKLALRRKGMSGKQGEPLPAAAAVSRPPLEPQGAFDRIAAMVPGHLSTIDPDDDDDSKSDDDSDCW